MSLKMRSIFVPILFLVFLATEATAQQPEAWADYDETKDLALLAEHDNERMRFDLLLSRVRDRNSIWQYFETALEAFGPARYQNLKPLILERSVYDLQAAVALGLLTYTDLTTFYLYRIREIETDPERFLNAVISLDPAAIERARALDARRTAGEIIALDSLFGIPVLLKDNIGAAGIPTTAGAVALAENLSEDAFITARLRESGAVILGKANLSEWAYFFCRSCPSGYSALGGQTLNPYGRFEFGTGGSSSGSGAAAATNMAAVTVGTETSGSILSPSSASSIVGLKPSTGALSRSGIVPISATLDTAGPMTRSVQDAVVLFNAMAGFDSEDTAMSRRSEDFRLVNRETDIDGWRLGALENHLDNSLFKEALARLTADGAIAVEVTLPDVDTEGFTKFLGAEMLRDLALYLNIYAANEVGVDSISALRRFNEQEPYLRAPYGQQLIDMMVELELDSVELEALRMRLQTAARSALDSLFSDESLKVLLSINNSNASLAALANYPALTVPLGYEEDGRAVGITIIAPSFQEQTLIDLGLRFEKLIRARRLPAAYR